MPGDPRLFLEPADHRIPAAMVVLQDLDGNLAVEVQIDGAEDDPHPPACDLRDHVQPSADFGAFRRSRPARIDQGQPHEAARA